MRRSRTVEELATALVGWLLEHDADRHWHSDELATAVGKSHGTIYPLLARLERRGLLTSGWDDPDLPEGYRGRRWYALAPAAGDASHHGTRGDG